MKVQVATAFFAILQLCHACTTVDDCTGTQYCNQANTCVEATACTTHEDCHGEFVSNLPFCDISNSICKDIGLTGTCTDSKNCAIATEVALGNQLGLMSVGRIIVNAAGTDRINTTKEVISRVTPSLTGTLEHVILVKNTESMKIGRAHV